MEPSNNLFRVEQNLIFQDDALPPFRIGKSSIDTLIGKYLSRKFSDELDYLESRGGITFLAESLITSLNDGLRENQNNQDPDDIFLRINAFDSNEPPVEEPISYCTFVWEALQDNIIRILIVCALAQTILEVTLGESGQENWVDGIAIIIAVLVVILVGSINNYIKEKEFQKLKKLMESDKRVSVKRDRKAVLLSVSKILVGDVMTIEEGMTIPADCILITGNNIFIDESAMTGEIDPVEKAPYDECLRNKKDFLSEHPDFHHHIPEGSHHISRSPIIPSGTKVSSGSGTVLVLAVGPNSENGKIMATIEANKSNVDGTPLQQKLTAIASFIGKLGIIAALLTSIAMAIRVSLRFSEIVFTSNDTHFITQIFIIGVVVIVVAIPEGLPLAVTISLAFSVKKMLDDQNFVRRMEACETMGGANYICTDKTGTLTKNEMTIVKIYDGVHDIEFEGTGDLRKEYFKNQTKYNLFKLCCACNTETSISSDGTENATFKTDLTFTKFLRLFHEDIPALRKQFVREINGAIPRIGFSSKRKKMSTILTSPDFPTVYRIFTKGASEIVLQSCKYYLDERNDLRLLTDGKREELQVRIKTYAIEALRTICACYKDIDFRTAEKWNDKIKHTDNVDNKTEVHSIEQDNFIFLGIIGIRDVLKDGVPFAVSQCQKAGITVIMVTGDNIDTAKAIAKKANICTETDEEDAILGDSFFEKIGGIVCENCFPAVAYKKTIEDNKKNRRKQDIKTIMMTLNYKCECYRTKDEGLMKYKQRIKEKKLRDDPRKFKQIYLHKEEKERFESEVEDEAKKEFEKSGTKIKKDIVANIEKFQKLISRIRVIARSQPNHKYALVTGLKQSNNVVAVTGDGTNDAPALSKADVGFAMGKMGTDIAKEAADIIIVDDNFTSIVNAIKWGRNIYDNIRRFLQFQLSVNIVACVLVFVGVAAGEESPLSAVQMLWLNMIMDSLGSLALATEKPTDELLDRQPYKRDEFIVNKKMFKHIFLQAIFQLVILLVLLFKSTSFIFEESEHMKEYGYALVKCFEFNTTDVVFYVPPLNNKKIFLISGFESSFTSTVNYTNLTFDNQTFDYCNSTFPDRRNLNDAYKHILNKEYATTHYTIIFNTFVLMQLFNQINCRILDDSFNVFRRICNNYLFILIWAVEMVSQVIIVQFSGRVFKVCANGLQGPHWAICIAFALLTYVISFLIKFVPDTMSKSTFNKELKISEGKVLELKKDSWLRQKNASMGTKVNIKEKNLRSKQHSHQIKLGGFSDEKILADRRLSLQNNLSLDNGKNNERTENNPIMMNIPV